MNIKLKAMLYTAGVLAVFLVLGFLICFYPPIGIGILAVAGLISITRSIYLIVLGSLGD